MKDFVLGGWRDKKECDKLKCTIFDKKCNTTKCINWEVLKDFPHRGKCTWLGI